MKAVQLTTTGDYMSHYMVDDHESWKEEVRVHKGYGLDRFEYREIPRPNPGQEQVVVQIKACGLNHLDAWAAKAPRTAVREKPITPGADMAGVVDEVGTGVTACSVGDRVMVYPGVKCNRCRYCLTGRDNLCPDKPGFGSGWDGGLAEYALVPEASIIPVPDNVSLIDAASLPIIFMTVWHMLVARARVQPGDIVLINAAGSGVGIAGIQIAKLFHARVIASAGSDAKLKKARRLGADEGINYSTSSIKEEVARLTDGYGVDIVVDSLSGNLAEESIEALAVGGRFVNCGCTLGNWATVNVARMLFKETSVMGSVMGTHRELQECLRLVSEGKLRAVIDQAYPLSQVRNAVAHLLERRVFGKVMVIPDSQYPPTEPYSTLD